MQNVISFAEVRKVIGKHSVLKTSVIIISIVALFVVAYSIGVNVGNVIHYLLNNTSC